MKNDNLDIAALLAIWIRGWALVRGLPAPAPMGEGVWRVDVNQPGQLVRYVLPDLKAKLLVELAHEQRTPASWLKVCAQRDDLAALLPPPWQMSDQRYFMSLPLAGKTDFAVSAGFALSLTETGPTTRAILRTLDGKQAADGNLILLGSHAVFDQIGTDEAFRRRGLGRTIMQALAERAQARGANTGLLVATEAGRHLYLTLGWHTLSPYASAFIPE